MNQLYDEQKPEKEEEFNIYTSLNSRVEEIGSFLDNYKENIYLNCITKSNKDLSYSLNEYHKTKKDFKKEYSKSSYFSRCFNKNYNNYSNLKEKFKSIEIKEKENIDKKIEEIAFEEEEEKQKIENEYVYYILFIACFFHFFAISEAYGLQFALFAEIKRTIIFYIKDRYDTDKIFIDFYQKSIFTDTSQVYLSYLSSFLTTILVSKFAIRKIYSISIFLIFFFMFSISNNDFLKRDDIKEGINYSNFRFGFIVLSFIFIYFFSGIIVFIPILILEKYENFNYKIKLLILSIITFSVIIKNAFHLYMQISPLLCSCLFILNSSIFLGYLFYMEKKTKPNNIIIENNKEKKNTPYYYFGRLCIKYENICVFIKIKGICEYISSFFDLKLLFVLFINFFSRVQKLKFKFEYKGILKIHENPGKILIINFIIIYIIAVSIYFIFIKIDPNKNKLKEEEKINDKQENNIIKAI